MKVGPEIAGGHVDGATLSVTSRVPAVFGCRLSKDGLGTYNGLLATPVDLTRVRAWVQNLGAIIPWNAVVTFSSPTAFSIHTYRLDYDPTPPGAVVLGLADYNFAFGISIVPE